MTANLHQVHSIYENMQSQIRACFRVRKWKVLRSR